ncbi:MAG: hypothetical protein LBJ17_01630 [Dysgonamonadaceae bacterium]|jgi:hypothetical protein|nr:hypothetical protein [Dysgonamonadaceae bacterium]
MANNSKIESGINTYVGNFNDIIGIFIELGDKYRPQNERLSIEAMQEQSSYIRMSINNVDDSLAEAIIAESNRKEAFEPLQTIATSVLAMARTFNLPAAAMLHIKELVRKIRGKRAKPIPVTSESKNGEPVKHISVSQMSFNEQIEHLTQLVDLLAHIPAYKPIEHDVTVTGLAELSARMGAANDEATQAYLLLSNARVHRNELLYAPVTGMMDTALSAKEYIKAVFGTSSAVYKQVHKIKFSNRKPWRKPNIKLKVESITA